MNSDFVVLKTKFMPNEVSVMQPRIANIVCQPSRGNTVRFRNTPVRDARPKAMKKSALILIPSLKSVTSEDLHRPVHQTGERRKN